MLGVEAALHTGVGMVRYLGAGRPTRLVLQRRPETVTAEGRVQAWVVGSGQDPDALDEHTASHRDRALADPVPIVIDAGALGFAVVNAAAEELAYNGVLQRALGLEVTSVWAVLTAATAFGASHWFGFPSGWWGVALAGVYGAMLSVLRQVSGGLLLPWIAHVLADLTIVAILVAIL